MINVDDILADKDMKGAAIGMDHVDKGGRKLAPSERAIKIWN
jgi:hypothetical protein